MKSFVSALLMIVVAALLAACGEDESGSEPTATPNYAILSLDAPTPTEDIDVEEDQAPPQATPSMLTATSTSTPEPTATPEAIDLGEMAVGVWDKALLTTEDMPAEPEWSSYAVASDLSEDLMYCGATEPTNTESLVVMSTGVLFIEPTRSHMVQESITEFTTPEAAQQTLLDTKTSLEAYRSCDWESMVDGGSSPTEAELPKIDVAPVELPPVGHDRIGISVTLSGRGSEPGDLLSSHVSVVRVNHLLIVISESGWGREPTALDSSLIESAVEKVEQVLTEPPVLSKPTVTTTPGTSAELDVSTISTCEQAAGAIVARLQTSIEILAPIFGITSAKTPPEVEELRSEVDAIEGRAHDIGCEDSTLGALVADGLEKLTFSDPVAEILADFVADEYLYYEHEAPQS